MGLGPPILFLILPTSPLSDLSPKKGHSNKLRFHWKNKGKNERRNTGPETSLAFAPTLAAVSSVIRIYLSSVGFRESNLDSFSTILTWNCRIQLYYLVQTGDLCLSEINVYWKEECILHTNWRIMFYGATHIDVLSFCLSILISTIDQTRIVCHLWMWLYQQGYVDSMYTHCI